MCRETGRNGETAGQDSSLGRSSLAQHLQHGNIATEIKALTSGSDRGRSRRTKDHQIVKLLYGYDTLINYKYNVLQLTLI